MTVKIVGGHLILETVAPSCHLVGQLQRDALFPNRLILTRNTDALSFQVRALTGRWLPTLKVTDPVGKSATISNVTFIDTKPIQSQATGPTLQPESGHSEQHDTNSLEEVSFTFQSISVENLATSTSSSDNVIGWPPPRHRRRDMKAIGTVCP